MAVLINMEMPKSCEDCRLVQTDENYYGDIMSQRCNLIYKGYLPETGRRPDCPLVEIPEPHGRLIDADATLKLLQGLGNRDYRREKGTIMEAMKMLSYEEYTPTIIPASEEGEA